MPAIRLRTIEWLVLVILVVTLTFWPTGFGRTMTVRLGSDDTCGMLKLQCCEHLCVSGKKVVPTCLTRICSTTMILVPMTVLLRLQSTW